MIDLSVMTSKSNYTYVPATMSQTTGLMAQRQSQLPSFALQSGNASMPPAWQTRNAPAFHGQRHDAPARSIADIVLDPWRFATATKMRKIMFGIAVALLALVVLL